MDQHNVQGWVSLPRFVKMWLQFYCAPVLNMLIFKGFDKGPKTSSGKQSQGNDMMLLIYLLG